MEINLTKTQGTVVSLGVLFTAFIGVETRYAKAADFDKLLRSQEQKIVWDLEENVETSEGLADKRKWFQRLKEKVDVFCDDYPDEDECEPEYLKEIEASIRD